MPDFSVVVNEEGDLSLFTASHGKTWWSIFFFFFFSIIFSSEKTEERKSFGRWRKFCCCQDWQSSRHLCVHELLLAEFLFLPLLEDAVLFCCDPSRCVLCDLTDGAQRLLIGRDRSHAIQTQLPVDLFPHLTDLKTPQCLHCLCFFVSSQTKVFACCLNYSYVDILCTSCLVTLKAT